MSFIQNHQEQSFVQVECVACVTAGEWNFFVSLAKLRPILPRRLIRINSSVCQFVRRICNIDVFRFTVQSLCVETPATLFYDLTAHCDPSDI